MLVLESRAYHREVLLAKLAEIELLWVVTNEFDTTLDDVGEPNPDNTWAPKLLETNSFNLVL